MDKGILRSAGGSCLLADQAKALLEGAVGIDEDSIYAFVELLVRALHSGEKLETKYEVILSKNPHLVEQRGLVLETCLHVCMLKNTPQHKIVAKFLVKKHPELVNMVYENDVYKGESALHMAIVNRDIDMVKFLVAHGADIHRPSVTGSFFRTCAEGGKVYFGASPLDFAVCSDDSAIVNFLIENGAEVNTEDYYGNTPLHLSVVHTLPDMYDLLLKHGADHKIANYEDLTPFLLAAKKGNAKMFDFILNRHKETLWKFGPILCSLYPVQQMGVAVELAVQGHHLCILDHRVTIEFLESKWKAYSRRRFWISCILEIFYFAMLLTAILLQPSNSNEDPYSSKNIVRYCFESAVYICSILYMLSQMRYIYRQSLYRLWKTHTITTFTSWVHCICIWLAATMRFMHENTAEDIFIAFAVVIGWIHLLNYHTGTSLTGAFVVMIQKMIVYDISRFASIYLVLLFGFAQAFFLLYRVPDIGSFQSIPGSIMATFLMSFGEFDYDILVELGNINLARGIFAHFFFISFIVLGTILMLNLLIAMMGNTFSSVLENAELEWRFQWTNMVMFLENSTSEKKREARKPRNMVYRQNCWWMMIQEPCEMWRQGADNANAEVPNTEDEKTLMKLPPVVHLDDNTSPEQYSEM